MNSSKKLIQLYLDGQLDESDRLRFEQILQDDVEARSELETYRKLREALKAAGGQKEDISQPDFMWSKVKAAVERSEAVFSAPALKIGEKVNPWWNWDFRWMFAGVTALVLCALTLSYFLWIREGSSMVSLDQRKQGYNAVAVYTYDPEVYPSEYQSDKAGANVIWLTGVNAYETAENGKT